LSTHRDHDDDDLVLGRDSGVAAHPTGERSRAEALYDGDDGMRDEDEATMRQQRPQQEEESKVRQVLLALGNRLSSQVVLGEHVDRMRLRRYLPAECAMLIAMLPPSASLSPLSTKTPPHSLYPWLLLGAARGWQQQTTTDIRSR
jgi:hypothetical protein